MAAVQRQPYMHALASGARARAPKSYAMRYVEVILPLALSEQYYYAWPDSLWDREPSASPIGYRVLVSFGRKRFYTGIVCAVVEHLPAEVSPSAIKPLEAVLDERPLVSVAQLEVWRWLAHYYHCSLGQVMRTALPGGLLPESHTIVYSMPDYVASTPLSPAELEILDALGLSGGQGVSVDALRMRLGRSSVSKAFTRLIELGAIYTEEAVRSRYQPRLRAYIGLAEAYQSEASMSMLLDSLARSPRQGDLLLEHLDYLSSLGLGYDALRLRSEVTRGDASRSAVLRKLVDKGILVLHQRADSRIDTTASAPSVATSVPSSPALDAPITLLYASHRQDKEYEIIAHVARTIEAGRQVLLLTPSAHDTPSATSYLEALAQASEHRVYHYHVGVSEAKRTELYQRLAHDASPCLVIGTRTAVFLPMQSLGLIIVDEEQEYMYKQQHAAPYFHARDVALYLGHRLETQVLLASTTPSAEALFNVWRGKYALRRRETSSALEVYRPAIETIDLGRQREIGALPYGRSLSQALCHEIRTTLDRGQRVLLLQNRRGYAPYMLCDSCGERVQCPQCDVSLHYFASSRQLRCPYCAYQAPVPQTCPSCGVQSVRYRDGARPALRSIGYGTERVEEEVAQLFPEARLMRIDSESLQTARSRAEIAQRIEAGDVDLLIGTQLIRGQAVWDNIGLIAVVQLDAILHYPDFRAGERAYQLLHQLLLRSTGSQPRLLLQTLQPDHPFIAALRQHDYDAYIGQQLHERQLCPFPPFVRMSYIRLRAFDEVLVEQTGQMLIELLRSRLGHEAVSDLHTPSVARVEMQYLRLIICRRPYSSSFVGERAAFAWAQQELYERFPSARRARIAFDIDPH